MEQQKCWLIVQESPEPNDPPGNALPAMAKLLYHLAQQEQKTTWPKPPKGNTLPNGLPATGD